MTTNQYYQDYASAGVSLVPVKTDGSKAPAVPWKQFQRQPADSETVQKWIDRGHGIGLIGGTVSGNLEVLDFEAGADIRAFADRLDQAAPGLRERLSLLVGTPTGGYHIIYRSSAPVEGNQKLACKSSGDVLIETRGEGGYVIAPGSPAGCHPSGTAYELLKGSFHEIPVLTSNERTTLLEAARSLNEFHPPSRIVRGNYKNNGERPGDEFNKRSQWGEILETHGWTKVFSQNGTLHWRRPGKKVGTSATTGHRGSDLLYVFSSNATPFEPDTSYSKFAAHSFLNFGGNFSAAASQLFSTGYGKQTSDKPADVQIENWGEPEELPPLRPEAPILPEKMIPEPLRAWVTDTAERMQVQLVILMAAVLVGLGSVVGRQLGVGPKQRDDWLVIPNLWGAVIARSGPMKTPGIEEGLKPLKRLAAESRKEFEAEMARTEPQREILELEIAALKSALKQAVRNDQPQEAIQEQLEAALRRRGSLEVQERRYITSDSTVPMLAELLRQNPSGLLVYRDEVTGLFMRLEAKGSEGDREFYLESWSGNLNYDVDRIGRGHSNVQALCLSIFGGIQPGKLDRYVEQTLKGGWGDDGFLQRFQILVFPEPSREWRNVDVQPNLAARKRVHSIFFALGVCAAGNLRAGE